MNENEQPTSPAITPAVPVAAIQSARKDLSNQVKAVMSAAMELEQLALIEEMPFEEDVATPPEIAVKRYTGTNGKRAMERREQVVKLLAIQVTAKNICDILKMSHHTVEAIAAQEAVRITTLGLNVADALQQSAMADFAVAETKRDQASPKDLAIIGGIKMTHATNMRLAGASGDDAAAVELEQENESLTRARKFLEARNPKPIETEEAK